MITLSDEITPAILKDTVVKNYNGEKRRYFPLGSNVDEAYKRALYLITGMTKEEFKNLNPAEAGTELMLSGRLKKIEFFNDRYWYRTTVHV